jgi:hypothetical protein
MVGAGTLGLASPASANTTTTPPPTVAECQQAFAATGLQAIRNFQASNFSPEANASLRGRLRTAELAFTVCLGLALQ